ncbi:NADH-quinone oxidoreductase subunit A [Endomicrobium proavitum]|uniref:NADH-quinone oxidoreductase subunit n=1 Tax=Endomicrobium proavitum TaxID=1408281 RepID=A0A0G3WHN0_9BACT|nr:NADH-quinone oxidoreductase subunit A [Endomicrobium proavitum]AKL97415.1 Ni,Fe-hydrogenase III small subunit [Endomicrobium proavitum]
MNFYALIILPPIVFAVVFAFMFLLARATNKIAFKNPLNPNGKLKAYACGEDVKEHRLKPEYSEFFPVAFFFTIMHVITLLLASTPADMKTSIGITALFVAVAYISILIIFRRERND